MLPRCWHKLFSILFPLTRGTTNNSSWTRHQKKILENRGETELPLAPQRSRKTALEGLEERLTWTTLPLPQAVTEPLWEVSHEPMVSSVEEESPGMTSSSPRIMGSFLRVPSSVLTHEGQGEAWCTWLLGIWFWWKRGREPAATSAEILAFSSINYMFDPKTSLTRF